MQILVAVLALLLLMIALSPIIRSSLRASRRKRAVHLDGSCHWYANYDEELRYEPRSRADIVRLERDDVVRQGYRPTTDVQLIPRTFRHRVPGDLKIRLWKNGQEGRPSLWLCEWATSPIRVSIGVGDREHVPGVESGPVPLCSIEEAERLPTLEAESWDLDRNLGEEPLQGQLFRGAPEGAVSEGRVEGGKATAAADVGVDAAADAAADAQTDAGQAELFAGPSQERADALVASSSEPEAAGPPDEQSPEMPKDSAVREPVAVEAPADAARPAGASVDSPAPEESVPEDVATPEGLEAAEEEPAVGVRTSDAADLPGEPEPAEAGSRRSRRRRRRRR